MNRDVQVEITHGHIAWLPELRDSFKGISLSERRRIMLPSLIHAWRSMRFALSTSICASTSTFSSVRAFLLRLLQIIDICMVYYQARLAPSLSISIKCWGTRDVW